MLQRFVPQLLMTFFICLFILMMQFLFRYINDLVGKGLSMDVLAELFFYAALSMVPMALPLAILLASLMTFGNLGEHFELTALKSSGISLIKVMTPLIILISMIAVGAFFFQNNVLPKTQVKMWTLLFSARQKSLSLDITEGSINTQIPGYNVYVKHKDRETGMLRDLIIYDVSNAASSYPRIVTADSGLLQMTADQRHIQLKLFHGNWYEDVKSGSGSTLGGSEMYRRESYHDKDILIPYDATFTRMDDDNMRSQYIGKDIAELRQSIDSIQTKVDSVGDMMAQQMQLRPIMGVPTSRMESQDGKLVRVVVKDVKMDRPVDVDSLYSTFGTDDKMLVVNQALNSAQSTMQDIQFRGFSMSEDNQVMRRHQIELQKKFTLSLACLIFFFIGGPLGAIIRKGGLGTPVVISVILFVIYYIIDNMGYKMARDGYWPVWQGIWLSSAVLLPLGVFLTQRAVNDSAVFNPDAWMNVLRRLTGMHQTRHLEVKDLIINEVDEAVALEKLAALHADCTAYAEQNKGRMGYVQYLLAGLDRDRLLQLQAHIEQVVEYLSNSRNQLVVNKTMDFPIVRNLFTYYPSATLHQVVMTRSKRLSQRQVGILLAVLFPIGLPLWLVGMHHQKNLLRDVRQAASVCGQLTDIFNGTDDRHQAN